MANFEDAFFVNTLKVALSCIVYRIAEEHIEIKVVFGEEFYGRRLKPQSGTVSNGILADRVYVEVERTCQIFLSFLVPLKATNAKLNGIEALHNLFNFLIPFLRAIKFRLFGLEPRFYA